MIRAGDYNFEIVNGKPFARGTVSVALPKEVIPLIELAEKLTEPTVFNIEIDESKIEELKAQILAQPTYVISELQEFKQFTLPTKINVNHATAAVLDLLPGVGAVTAKQIVEVREEKPFVDFADLQERTGVTLKSEVAELIEF